jgi:sugar phosphate isomerase/epimerase
MKYVRLKSDIKPRCLKDRLQYNPEIIELHLTEQDLVEPLRLINAIRQLQANGVVVYLHHPMSTNGKMLDILSSNTEISTYYEWSTRVLVDICKNEGVQCVIHAHYSGTESSFDINIERTKLMKDNISKILEYGYDFLLWEDTIGGLFSYQNPYLISELIEPLNLRVNVDISHTFISLNGDNNKLIDILESTKEFAKYYHIVDSQGVTHDGLSLGQGGVDWIRVKPYIHNKPFIFEIALEEPHDDCTPMIDSYKYYMSI